MSNITQLPSAVRFRDLQRKTRGPKQEFLLRIEHTPQLHEFLDLLKLIYGSRPSARMADMGTVWICIKAESHRTLSGVRVAAWACGLSFEEVGNIT